LQNDSEIKIEEIQDNNKAKQNSEDNNLSINLINKIIFQKCCVKVTLIINNEFQITFYDSAFLFLLFFLFFFFSYNHAFIYDYIKGIQPVSYKLQQCVEALLLKYVYSIQPYLLNLMK
jgi:hypothetical protein